MNDEAKAFLNTCRIIKLFVAEHEQRIRDVEIIQKNTTKKNGYITPHNYTKFTQYNYATTAICTHSVLTELLHELHQMLADINNTTDDRKARLKAIVKIVRQEETAFAIQRAELKDPNAGIYWTNRVK